MTLVLNVNSFRFHQSFGEEKTVVSIECKTLHDWMLTWSILESLARISAKNLECKPLGWSSLPVVPQ